ncbi:MAG: potassium-transporting ATPase subunit F [Propionibacteriaceae bacterium]|nr:potassium-transporting ATPase subunit F [Propionibacteriaceae bacterium]
MLAWIAVAASLAALVYLCYAMVHPDRL